jgi:hypothetical protein
MTLELQAGKQRVKKMLIIKSCGYLQIVKRLVAETCGKLQKVKGA